MPHTKPTPLFIIVIGLGAFLYHGCTAPRPIDRFHGYLIGFMEGGMASFVDLRSLCYGKDYDRGSFARGRILDLSLAGAQALGMVGNGTDQIELRVDYNSRPEGIGVLRVQVGAFAGYIGRSSLFGTD
jgi:rare lipoprotein A